MTGQVNYLVEAPELGQECYVLHIQQNLFYSLFKWGNKDLEKDCLPCIEFMQIGWMLKTLPNS